MRINLNRDRLIRQIDWILILAVITILIIGILIISSATHQARTEGDNLSELYPKQLIFIVFSLFILAITWLIDYHQIKGYYFHLYGLNLFFLLLVLLLGNTEPGAQRWIEIGSFQIQPSEISKIIIIITLAAFLSTRKGDLTGIKDIVFAFIHISIPTFFIFLQPDLGTSLVLIAVLIGQLFIAGIKIKHLGVIFIIGFVLIAIILNFNLLKEYQMNRLLVFLNPDLDPQGAGYNLSQSKIAIGSGQIFGKGLYSGTQTNLRFLPARHTDFIFSVVGEELGFLGTSMVLVLYFIIIGRGITIALSAKDIYGALVSIGIVAMWMFQITVNIGMTIGIMPITGIPLPFLSYGGSSMLINMVSVGLLLNIYSRRFKTSRKIMTV